LPRPRWLGEIGSLAAGGNQKLYQQSAPTQANRAGRVTCTYWRRWETHVEAETGYAKLASSPQMKPAQGPAARDHDELREASSRRLLGPILRDAWEFPVGDDRTAWHSDNILALECGN